MVLGEKLLQRIVRLAHQSKLSLAGTLVLSQQTVIVQGAPTCFGGQHTDQLLDIGKSHIEPLTGQWVHIVGGIPRQNPATNARRANPTFGLRVLQRPDIARASQCDATQMAVTCGFEVLAKL